MLVQDEVLGDKKDSEVILEVPAVKLGVNGEALHLPVLVGVGLGLVLGVPLPAPDL